MNLRQSTIPYDLSNKTVSEVCFLAVLLKTGITGDFVYYVKSAVENTAFLIGTASPVSPKGRSTGEDN